MKKIYMLAVMLLMGSALTAQHRESDNILEKLIWDDKMLNIMLDTRIDFQMNYGNNDLDDMSFHGQTVKIWLAGEIVPGIRYRVRHRLNKPQTPLREGYSGATDQAWIAFDFGKAKSWTIMAGKQSVQFGTFEYDYNPADIYLPTMTFNDLDAYKTGVNVTYRFLKQAVNLQVVNSDAPQFASEKYKNKALGISFLWEGDLFKNLLKTRWAYSAFQHEGSKFYNWFTLGTQLNVGKFTTELDYYYGSRGMDYGSVVGDDNLGARYVRDQSAALNLKFDFGMWRPSVKGIWNERRDKLLDENAYNNFGGEVVMEFYPFAGLVKDLRFHAAYSYNNTNFKGIYSGLSDTYAHTFIVGMRWLFKVK